MSAGPDMPRALHLAASSTAGLQLACGQRSTKRLLGLRCKGALTRYEAHTVQACRQRCTDARPTEHERDLMHVVLHAAEQ